MKRKIAAFGGVLVALLFLVNVYFPDARCYAYPPASVVLRISLDAFSWSRDSCLLDARLSTVGGRAEVYNDLLK